MIEPLRDILALVPNWLGDVAMCTPALRTLHQKYPDAEVTVVGRAPACSLLEGLTSVHRFVAIPPKPNIIQMISIARALRPHARDLAVVFPHSFRSAMLAKMSGADRIIGYERNRRGWLLTDKIPPNSVDGSIEPVYMTWEYLDLLDVLDVEYDGFGLELSADGRAIAAAQEHLVGPGPFVGFAPGAAFGPSKRWLPERYAEVADRLAREANAQCVLLTGPGEEETRDAVIAAAQTSFVQCDEGHPTIDTLKATMSQLNLLVCNDSGPRHVAVAFGVPTICVMGSTKPVYSEGPYEKGEVVRVDVDCGPCQKATCPTGTNKCMTEITTDAVVEAALRHISPSQVRS